MILSKQQEVDEQIRPIIVDTPSAYNEMLETLESHPILVLDCETVGMTALPLMKDLEVIEQQLNEYHVTYGDRLKQGFEELEQTKKFKKDYEDFLKLHYEKVLMVNLEPDHREKLSNLRKRYLQVEKEYRFCKDYEKIQRQYNKIQKQIDDDKSGLYYNTNYLGVIQLGTIKPLDKNGLAQFFVYPELVDHKFNILLRTRQALVGVNLKFDLLQLYHHRDITFDDCQTVIYDLMLADKMIRSGKSRSFGLKAMAEFWLDYYQDKTEQISNWLRRPLTPEQIQYGARDVLTPALIFHKIRADIEMLGLKDCTKLQMDFLKVLTRIQRVGMYVDLSEVEKLISDIDKEVEEQRTILGNWLGDPGLVKCKDTESPKETLKLLNDYGDRNGIEVLSRLASTSADTFNEIEENVPLLDSVTAFRSLLHTKANYCQAFKEKHINGRIHSDFVQLQKEGTRGSSKDPNMQNIPRPGEFDSKQFTSIYEAAKTWEPKARLRTAFKAAPGKKLYVADYGAIELCMMAYTTQDDEMCNSLINKIDLHSLAAKSLFLLSEPVEAIKKLFPDKRQIGKTFNFSTGYGAGIMKLLKLLWKSGIFNFNFEDVRSLRSKWYGQFKGVKDWQNKQLEFVKQHGYCETRLGRKIFFQEPDKVYSDAFNYPIAASCYEGLQRAVVLFRNRVYKLEQAGIINPGDIELVNLVHDEFVVEADENIPEEKIINLMISSMKDGMQPLMDEYRDGDIHYRRIPVEVDCKRVECWAEKG